MVLAICVIKFKSHKNLGSAMVVEREQQVVVDGEGCIVHTNVFTFDFTYFMSVLGKFNVQSIEMCYMDPPWAITNSDPYRGVSVNYECKKPCDILNSLSLPFAKISYFFL